MGVQGDVAVRAELTDRNVEPVSRADLDDGVDRQVQELTLTQTGPSQELHRQADERVGVVAGGLQQLGCRGVIQEARQRAVAQWKVTSEHQDAGGDVVASPLGQPSKHVRRQPRCSARLILLKYPPRAEGRLANCSL